ncbi:MAG: 4-hydroxy-tetrahydrodipicolinate synthase [Bacteroidota bacterium]|nr:4-hydroxy-tetrahydrodipicolinate synthase [Bacteroidota bacterium]MDP3144753.1 4-hydroxy-tetrahydrodipicolinate synthase [Bacteroidota bacterium]MDP3557876.1 4-hydroxy-tetrahydrodipicolinate synthase [Bacteroidota bacterium]
MRNNNLKGTGVAIVTPFTKKGNVDTAALTNIVKHLHSGKVEYIVILGTTGETATLSKEEKQLVIDTVIKANANKLRLVLGIGGNNTAEVVETIKKTDLKPFEAILSVAPYYNKPNQEGYYQHYKTISQATKKDIILYNVPGRTGSNVTWETQVRIAKDFKNIVATKEASGSIEQIMKIIKHKPKDFSVISGDDNLTLAVIAAGGDGVISVVANAFPKDYSEMVRLSLKHKFTEAQKLHYGLLDITDQLFADGNPGGIKYALSLLKKCESYLRLPLCEPSDKVKQALKQLIKNYK